MQALGNPLLVALIAFLVLATIEDVANRRISNLLTFSAAGVALTLQFVANDFHGLLFGLGGLAVGLGIFLPFFLLGGMGAGDVKMMAAVGAFLGPLPSLLATGLSLIAGAALGVAVLALRGASKETFKRYALGFLYLASTGQFTLTGALAGEAAHLRFPYAPAIAAGTLCAVYWLWFR